MTSNAIKYLLLKRTTKGECRVPKNFNFRSSGGSNWWARICDHFIHASVDSFLRFLEVWGCKETMRITCCYLCTRNSPSWSMEMHLANIHFCEKPRKGAQLSFCTRSDINTRQPSWFIPTKMLQTSNKVGQRHPSKLSESTMQLEPLERPKPAFQLDLSYTTSVPRRRCSGQKLAPGECRLPMDSLVCKESRPILHHVQVKTHTASWTGMNSSPW